MQPSHDGEIVATGTLPGYEYVSIRHGAEVIHRIKVTGRITLKQRLPLYDATLAINPSSTYLCILDNSGDHENDLTFADMQVLDQQLVDARIGCFYGATITADRGYPMIIDLANASMSAMNIKGEVMSTDDPEVAERFLAERMRLLSDEPSGSKA